MKRPYNGHESWNAWNVALWIGNDEGLYRCALYAIRRPWGDGSGRRVSANLATLRFLRDTGLQDQRTPDGARYSFHSVKLAIAGLMDD
jgi:hypothetical protein